jgi:hypothetical protein
MKETMNLTGPMMWLLSNFGDDGAEPDSSLKLPQLI